MLMSGKYLNFIKITQYHKRVLYLQFSDGWRVHLCESSKGRKSKDIALIYEKVPYLFYYLIYYRPPECNRLYDVKVLRGYALLGSFFVLLQLKYTGYNFLIS